MRILVACEESQAVTIELRKLGHDAYSCDVQPCSGGVPAWHIEDDVLNHINGGWDMIIAFPPCTHLSSSGARWWAAKRADGRQQAAVDFFMRLAGADCPKIAIENPVGFMSTAWRKPDQIIQPWQFGHGEVKTTCLWLKGLPHLQPTEVCEGREQRVWRMPERKDRAKLRSKTYPGIARAMAEQWGGRHMTDAETFKGGLLESILGIEKFVIEHPEHEENSDLRNTMNLTASMLGAITEITRRERLNIFNKETAGNSGRPNSGGHRSPLQYMRGSTHQQAWAESVQRHQDSDSVRVGIEMHRQAEEEARTKEESPAKAANKEGCS